MSALNFRVQQLNADTLEGQCNQWHDFPKPGWIIDFTTPQGAHFYAQIQTVQPIEGDSQSLHLSLMLLSGNPEIQIKSAETISPLAFYKIQHARETPKIPLKVQGITLDLDQSGRLVYVKPNRDGLQQNIVKALIKAQQPVVIIDPVGLDWGYRRGS